MPAPTVPTGEPQLEALSAEETRRALASLTKLPSSFNVILKALELTEQPFCTNAMLQDVLYADPGAASGLLRLANSAYFGVRSQIRTLSTAVRVVGRRRLQALLRHLLVNKLFELLAAENPDSWYVRDRGLAAGTVCSAIGENSTEGDADELRLAGLIHNIGELALVSLLPDRYSIARHLEAHENRPTVAKNCFGLRYGEISGWLMNAWRFPDLYVDAAVHAARPSEFSGGAESVRAVRAVHVGSTLGEAWLRSAAPESLTGSIDAAVPASLELDEERLLEIYDGIAEGVEQLKECL